MISCLLLASVSGTELGSALLAAALGLIAVCWVYLNVRSLYSHMRTPVIREDLKKPKPKDSYNLHLPFVSVIVPARNEQYCIKKCLLSILRQNYPNYEVIAIDDDSSDGTLEVLKRMESDPTSKGKLKVISVTSKPAEWTGKTWACQQGYLHSKGKLLLFTDADSHFESQNAIAVTIDEMLSENLDVLTGVPYLPLRDFWSRVVMPVWNLFSEVFDRGIADVNNSNSKVAFVMGSYFLIKRSTFVEIGTYDSVKEDIQEDRAIGLLLKRKGNRMKMFKIDSLVSALWSRDLQTLWDGIRRSDTPAAKSTLVSHQLIFFVMIVLPYLLFPYSAISYNGNPQLTSTLFNRNLLPLNAHSYIPLDFPTLFSSIATLTVNSMLLLLNSVLCIMIIIVTSVKGIMKYKQVFPYSILCFIGASFLIACYVYDIIPYLIGGKAKPIVWRGRSHDIVLHEKRQSADL
jgi:chlorobactene glucosyltransferase